MGEVLKIFISATTADLGEVRRAARAALEANPYFKPIEQAHFGPAAETLGAGDRRRLAECDAVLHIVGECYGHEPPPSERPRRSYTQLEHDDARALKKPLYLFVCADGFPYPAHDPEPADRRALQAAHRTTILNGHDRYELIADLPAFEQKIREIDLPLQRLLAGKARTRRLVPIAVGILCLCLVLFGVHLLSKMSRTPQASADAARQGVKEEMRAEQVFDPVRIKANMEKTIREDAAKEIAKLKVDPAENWRKIQAIEKDRDQQLGDIDRAVYLIGQAFEKKEASEVYRDATDILKKKGVVETLEFLDSKSAARDAKIAMLKGGLELTDRVRGALESKLREALREKLLTAQTLETLARWDDAETVYREVIDAAGMWPEPRNQLARLLRERGEVIDPAVGKDKLKEAVDLCRGTLAANPREADEKSWADAQHCLGRALTQLGRNAAGAESLDLLNQAVAAFHEALKVRTPANAREDWAATQNYLGNALSGQGYRATGAQSRRLLDKAVKAYQFALEIRTPEHAPREWAITQGNIGTALLSQATRAEGPESLRLLREAAEAASAKFKIFTLEKSPQSWADAKIDLGQIFWDHGRRVEGPESTRLLREAEKATRASVEAYMREQLPQGIARAQMNLGLVLWEQSKRADEAESLRLLDQAEESERAALNVHTYDKLPFWWAETQTMLGAVLLGQGTRAEGARSLRLLAQAEEAERAALKVQTLQETPDDWAWAQDTLGKVLSARGKRAEGAEGARLLRDAVTAYRDALTVRTHENFPFDWRETSGNLARTLRALAERVPAAEAEPLKAQAEGIDKELAAAH